MVVAIVLVVLAILLGLGGLLFTALKWLLIIAAVLLVAGLVMRGRVEDPAAARIGQIPAAERIPGSVR